MKKVITAIGNQKINKILKAEKEVNIICKDIQYKEAIFEILKTQKVDFLIISDGILDSENLYKEINIIKKAQEKIKIILLFKNKNENLEKIKKQKNIYVFYWNKKINNEKITEKIKKILLNNNDKKILKKEYLLFDSKLNKKIKSNKKIFLKDKKIFLLVEANLTGIENGKKIIEELLQEFNIEEKNIYIIIDNYNSSSIDMFIIKRCFDGIKIIGKIKNRRKKFGNRKCNRIK